MASGLFANQFNYANAYQPVGLDTGAISVGATLGKRPKTPSEDDPVRTPTSSKETSNTAAGATAGMSQAMAGGAGATSAVGAGSSTANQGTMNRLARMESELASGSQSVSTGSGSDVSMPKQGGAQVNHPAPSTGGGGFWSGIGHDVSSGVSDVNHFLQSGPVHDVMDFGDPFHGTGAAGLVSPAQQATKVIKPTNVYTPGRTPSPELPSGGPNVVQGSVESPGSVGAGTFRALPQGTGYDNLNLGPQFYSKPASTASRLSATADTPWYDSIPNDLSSLGEDVFSSL